MNMCLYTIEPLCCTPETDIEIKYFPIIFYKKAMGRIRRLDTAEEGIWKIDVSNYRGSNTEKHKI